METKYLLYRNCEQDFDNYEEYSEIVGYCDTEEDAFIAKKRLTNDLKYLKDLINAAREYLTTVIIPKFPLPILGKMLDVPKWNAGLGVDDITLEMRVEREYIKAKNDADKQCYEAKVKLRNAAIDESFFEYANSLPLSLEALQMLLDEGKMSIVNETKFFSYIQINKL